MIRTVLFAGLLAAAVPAWAQTHRAPAPEQTTIALQDHPACTRAELKAATDAYVKAQSLGDTSVLPLSTRAQYLENMKTIDAGAGLWNTALPIAQAMSFHDDKRCKTFTEIVVTDGGHPYVIGTRLYMNNGNIIRIDSLVTDKGDWLFNANAYLKYVRQEGDWQDLHPFQRTSSSEMMRGVNAYLDAFSDKFTDVPWGMPCARLEGGFYTNHAGNPDPSCSVGIPAGVVYTVRRDFLIDEEKGVVNVFLRFADLGDMPDSHSFRFIDGKIRSIHTLTVNLSGKPVNQADDNGIILKN
jgi:hypothetical protein